MGNRLPPRLTFISTRGPAKSKAALSAHTEVGSHSTARKAIENPQSTLLLDILNLIKFIRPQIPKIYAPFQGRHQRTLPRYKLCCTWNFICKGGWELPSIQRKSQARLEPMRRFYWNEEITNGRLLRVRR